jgi:flagellum-specific peptidoglycan hydrolase FlgJ/LysM repeat protein
LCLPLISVFAQEPVKPAAYETKTAATTDAAEAADAAAAAGNSEYVKEYKDLAIQEMERSGIPASIKLAQAILESNSGQSDLAQKANNHFGIKCTSSWSGKSYEKVDDEKDEDGKPKKSCFRKYAKVEESFTDHSEFLRDPRKYYRYGFLFGLDKKDYRSWARGLESAGYATGAGYADKLIGIIEKNQLYMYDDPETRDASSQPSKPRTNQDNDPKNKKDKDDDGSKFMGRIGRVNDVKVVTSRAGETVDDIARTFRISPEKVAHFNERRYTPGQPLPTSTRVFIQEKKSKWRGRTTHHFVREGQTMFDISQQYGIRLAELQKRNGLNPGQEVAAGERIRIRGRRKSSEIVRLRDPEPVSTPAIPSTGKPSTTKPNTKPDKDEELGEITGGGKQNEAPPPSNKPSTTTPSTPPATPPPAPTPTRPSTSTGSTPGTPSGNGSGSWPGTDPTPTPTRPTPAPTTPPTANVPNATYHTVVKGDTLFSLSRKYGTPVAKIKALNGMTSDAIKIGEKLRVK